MKKTIMAVGLFCLFVGCGEPPAPIGAAAEASTAEIEITMDLPVLDSGLAVAE